jgi:hypothetical protein
MKAAAALIVMVATAAAAQSETKPLCMDAAMREQVRRLLLDGFDQALKNHVEHLFDVRLKDRAGCCCRPSSTGTVPDKTPDGPPRPFPQTGAAQAALLFLGTYTLDSRGTRARR